LATVIIFGLLVVMVLPATWLAGQPAAPQSAGDWTEKQYQVFDCERFENYEPANRPIDFQRIDYPLLHAAIFYATNRVRLANGREPFRHLAALEQSAAMHAGDMAELDFFSHHNPFDPKRADAARRMALCGITTGRRSENIAETFGIRYRSGDPLIPPKGPPYVFRDFDTRQPIPNHSYNSFAEALLEEWMGSPAHRGNILDPRVHYLGCGARHFLRIQFYYLDCFKAVQNFSSSKR